MIFSRQVVDFRVPSLVGALLFCSPMAAWAEWPAVFSDPADVVASSDGFTVPGDDISLTLGFAPDTGTALTVVNNTSIDFIDGEFLNLSHGEILAADYGGLTYSFVANYFGGDGNDLVLQWASNRVMGWGRNSHGELGDGTKAIRKTPVNLSEVEAISGKWFFDCSIFDLHGLVLLSDGKAVSFGDNPFGQLGDGTSVDSLVPTEVDARGVLEGKTVVSLLAGEEHSLVLCGDGTVATWGRNQFGQLGKSGTNSESVPVVPDGSGGLTGKKVVRVSAGRRHNLALCSDGSLFAWGSNSQGQLTGPAGNVFVPQPVDQGGALAGKDVVQISAGGIHSLALCSDGTLATWGTNSAGSLGNGTNSNSSVPVAVDQSGVLAGKAVTRVSCGNAHTLALCSDGTLVSWGSNSYGVLGDGTTVDRNVPVLVDTTGVLAGKTVVDVSAGTSHSMAVCSDGTVVAWGRNTGGQLGTGDTTGSLVPVVSSATMPNGGGRVTAISAGTLETLSLVATPLSAPKVETLDATSITSSSAKINGLVNANGNLATLSFEFGGDESYGTTVEANPIAVDGLFDQVVSGVITGHSPGTTYHFRVMASNALGSTVGADVEFTTLSSEVDANLSALTFDVGSPSPEFTAGITAYRVNVPSGTLSVTPTATTSATGANLSVNGSVALSGSPADPISLSYGDNPFEIEVVAPDGLTMKTYGVTIFRELPEPFMHTFDGGGSVPVTAEAIALTGKTLAVSLGFAPPVGAELMLIRNPSILPINGNFTNLSQGQAVSLEFEGESYPFVVDYFGGDGNDLVLKWAITRVAAWGPNFTNTHGRLADGTTHDQGSPVISGAPGIFSNRTVLSIGGSGYTNLARCSDGSLLEWGGNAINGIPVEGDGALAGKALAKIDTCGSQQIVLSVDGALYARGLNNYGQLGHGGQDFYYENFVEVDRSGALYGRRVVSMSSSLRFVTALLDNGALVSWGFNSSGALGSSASDPFNMFYRSTPAPIDPTGALEGRSVVAVSSGRTHTLALCSDGVIAAWGSNDRGVLGSPGSLGGVAHVEVDHSGVLSGRKVVAIDAGLSHNLALCSDGSVVSWGWNEFGELGDGSFEARDSPVEVATSGALHGKTVTKVSAGPSFSLALCSDGTLVAWGRNDRGQLGDGTFQDSPVPVAVDIGNLGPGARIVDISNGGEVLVGSPGYPCHGLAVVAYPVPSAPIEIWKQTELGDAYAGDLGDFDHDGLPLLIEYAVNFDPTVPDFASLPLGGLTSYPDGDRLSMAFMRDPNRNDITMVIEANENLAGDWSPLATSVNGDPFTGPGLVWDEDAGGGLKSVEVRDLEPAGEGNPRRFIRLRVFR